MRKLVLLATLALALPCLAQYQPPPGGGGGVSDGQQLFDVSHVLSMDAGARALIADDAVTSMISWDNHDHLYLFPNSLSNNASVEFFNGNASIYWDQSEGKAQIYVENGFFDTLSDYSGDEVANIDLLNRKLYADNGTTMQLSWANPNNVVLFANSGSDAVYFYRAGAGGNAQGQVELDVDHVTNSSGDAGSNIDLLNRKLYAPQTPHTGTAAGGAITIDLPPVDGDTITLEVINDAPVDYTFVDAGPGANEVLIGADENETAANLLAVLVTGGFIDNNSSGNAVKILQNTPGAAGNTPIATSNPSAMTLWDTSLSHPINNLEDGTDEVLPSREMMNWSDNNDVGFFGGVTGFSNTGPYGDDGYFERVTVNSSNNNIDVANRKLYASDGTTEILSWSNASSISLGPGGAWGGFNDPGQLSIDALSNNTGDGEANIDLLNRKLYNPDGTTVAIDYGGSGQVKLGDVNHVVGAGLDLIFFPTSGTAGMHAGAVVLGTSVNSLEMHYDEGDSSNNKVLMTGLPTSDPLVANQLWNDGGTLKISAGP